MNVHIIIDFMHIYYRYKFSLDNGKLRILNDPATGIDISNIYYTLKDIEGIRKSIEVNNNVTMSICLDTKSSRMDGIESMSDIEKEIVGEYKGNRVKQLTGSDETNILEIESLLKLAGYNVFKISGFEADDLIYHLALHYRNTFDYTVIYTNDADLAVNVKNNVGLMRYKIKHGYIQITDKNYSDILSSEYKCIVPYNAVQLFKCTCGDSSDCIKGIKGFGPKAFDKLIGNIINKVDWNMLYNSEYVYSALEQCSEYLSDTAIQYAKASLKLVRPLILNNDQSSIVVPRLVSTKEQRYSAYMKYSMQSLV